VAPLPPLRPALLALVAPLPRPRPAAALPPPRAWLAQRPLPPQVRAPSIPLERHRSGMANGGGGGGGGLGHQRSLDGDEDKYARRAHPLQRTLQRVLPGLFPGAGLPVTIK
jgi:hypothetical protein